MFERDRYPKLRDRNVSKIGCIPQQRLKHIPTRYRSAHEFCFHLHDLMVARLKEVEESRAHHVRVFLDNDEIRRVESGSVPLLHLLSQTGRQDKERRIAINHISVTLFADMLHFVFEGLRALEKRKFTVALCLLRKPFREGMLISARMCSDENLFMDTFSNNVSDLTKNHDRDHVIEEALKRCRALLFTNSKHVLNSFFDKGMDYGLAKYFDLATHYVTDFSLIATDNYNMNFIFKNPKDTDIYEGVYEQLARGLLFLNMMQIELYGRMSSVTLPGHFNWVVLTSMAIYQAIFIPGPCAFARMFNGILSKCFQCKRCGNPIRILKADVPRLCVLDSWLCKKCKTSNKIPLTQIIYSMDADTFDDLFV